jgi:hypothetical protein
VQVRYDEELATHVDPEPCADAREDVGEASVGVRAGQPLSRDNWIVLGADMLLNMEGNTGFGEMEQPTDLSHLPESASQPTSCQKPSHSRRMHAK